MDETTSVWMTPSELMAALRISRSVYERLVREGMPHITVGGTIHPRRRFQLEEVEHWLRNRYREE